MHVYSNLTESQSLNRNYILTKSKNRLAQNDIDHACTGSATSVAKHYSDAMMQGIKKAVCVEKDND